MSVLAAHPRIVVVGPSGSGKSTFARRAAEKLGRTHVELDELYWAPNWTPHPDFLARVERAIAQDEWVIAGNYRAVREQIWSRATAILFLDVSLPVAVGRVVTRTIRRIVTREELFGGNRESFVHALLHPQGVLIWLLHTHAQRRRDYRASFPRFPNATVFVARTRREADALLAD